MILKERKEGFCKEYFQEIREGITTDDTGKESSRIRFSRCQSAKVPGLVLCVDANPPEKELRRYAKEMAEIPNRHFSKKIQANSLKDKRQRILAIRDNEIRKDGMGMAAPLTFDPADVYHTLPCVAFNEIDQESLIGSKGSAITGGTATRAYFCHRGKSLHECRKERFHVKFIKIYLACKKVLSYHRHVHKCWEA